jgi:hypothetical protein
MNTERNWGAEPLRRPTIGELDTLVISEHGRVINNTDYRSHWFCIVSEKYGGYALLVKHGGGEERIALGYGYKMKPIIDGMEKLDGDTRYLIMHQLYDVHRDARLAESGKYQRAFASGQLKKERVRGGTRTQARYRVWIERAA